jgi:chromate reductase
MNCLRGKPVAGLGATTGLFGAVWAQAELPKVLQAIGADLVETSLLISTARAASAARAARSVARGR